MLQHTSILKSTFVFSLGFMLLSGTALAQTLPSSVDPGRVQNDIRQQLAPSAISTPVDVSTTPDVEAPAGAEKVKLVLKKVVIEGNKNLSADQLAEAYKGLIGTQITLADVYQIANKVTRVYRDKGYLLSRAIVPKQQIRDGIIYIQVIEGRVSNYTIEGKDFGARDQIKAYADRLMSTGTLNSQNLERYLLLMNDLPGIKVRSVLSPSQDQFGGSNMRLIVEQKKFQGNAAVDNLGNSYLGPTRFTVGGQANSLFGSSDQINAAMLVAPHADELEYYSGGFTHNVGSEGTKAGINASYAKTKPTLPDALGGQLDPKGESYTIGTTVNHPFIRSRSLNVIGGLGFDFTRNNTNYDDVILSPLQSRDDQRIARVSGQANYLDNYAGYNTASVVVSKGLEILGASEKGDTGLSRVAGDPGFTKAAAEVTRLQRIYGALTGLVGITGQYSADALLASEEFGFGGSQYGRGYDFSEITGDHGVAGKAELAYTLNPQRKYLDSYQFYAFYDIGKVWNRDPGAGQDSQDSAASTGIGTRMSFTQYLQGDAFVAKPLTRTVTSRGIGGDDLRFKFAISSTF